ncbi:MAG TPA: tripartite tricarboxylate transporter substrate binding protein [Xanthobacteraceae bacterium]|nr:tripartite tricarboxylate transporter substrate binding protein [Xanthobacteraceae bacterium]
MIRIVSCIVLCLASLAGLLTAFATPAAAQERFPTKQVRIIVPFPAGGPIDVMARLVAQKLTPTLGQVIIENRPGGGSTVGLKAAVTAEPDGHTLMFGGLMTLSVLPSLSKALDIDPANGFAPVIAVSGTPFVLIVPPRVSARTVQQLIAYARENPGKVNFGAPAGATPIMVGELFKLRTGINITTVPYRGAATVMTDMLSGQIDMSFEPTSITLAHVNDGKVRPLAITSATRNSEMPEVPTMLESGVPDMVAVSWTGLIAPPRTPPAIVARLNQEVNTALKSEDMIAALRKLGSSPLGGTPQDFRKLLIDETPKWLAVMKSSGMKID